MTEINHPEIVINPPRDVLEAVHFPDPSDTQWQGGGLRVFASQCLVVADAKFVYSDGVTAIRRVVETVGAITGNIPPENKQRNYQTMLFVEPEEAGNYLDNHTEEYAELYTVDTIADGGERIVRKYSVSRRDDRTVRLAQRQTLNRRSSITLPKGGAVTLLWGQGIPGGDEKYADPNFARDFFLEMWDIKRMQPLTPFNALGRLLVGRP